MVFLPRLYLNTTSNFQNLQLTDLGIPQLETYTNKGGGLEWHDGVMKEKVQSPTIQKLPYIIGNNRC